MEARFLKEHLKVSGPRQGPLGPNRHGRGIEEVSNKRLFDEITVARNYIDKLETKIIAWDGFLNTLYAGHSCLIWRCCK